MPPSCQTSYKMFLGSLKRSKATSGFDLYREATWVQKATELSSAMSDKYEGPQFWPSPACWSEIRAIMPLDVIDVTAASTCCMYVESYSQLVLSQNAWSTGRRTIVAPQRYIA